MADKPSRGLVLYGDGLIPAISPSHSHLHSLASKACCGFLSLPHSPPSESEEERIVREFALLLDAYEAYADKVIYSSLGAAGKDVACLLREEGFSSVFSKEDMKSMFVSLMQSSLAAEKMEFGKVISRMIYQAADMKMGKENAASSPGHVFPTISERFMGLKAAIVTNNSELRSFTEKLGCTVLQHEHLKEARHDLDQEPPVEAVCNDLLNLLGIQGGKVSATSPFDLVFVHIGAGECVEGMEEEVKTSGIEYVNELVGHIMHLAQPGSEIGSRLLLSLVMSYGDVSAIDCSRYSVLTSKDGWNSDLSKLCRPRQSYTMRGESPREDVRHHCPMLLAQWQDAVTRMDMTKLLSFEDFKESGGNLVIPADRMLHEIAFKQWKAPKYGA